MLQQGHLVAAPALCRKQHGVADTKIGNAAVAHFIEVIGGFLTGKDVAVGTQITGVCNKDLVHDVVQVCVIIEKNESALESLFCVVCSTWMKEEQYGKVSSRNAHVVIFDNDTPCFFCEEQPLRLADLPPVKMHPVILIAALTRGS